jgi:signal transduction histidine kinase
MSMVCDSNLRRRGRLWPVAGLLALAFCCAAAEPPKRVLIVNSFGREVAPFSAVASAFRTGLTRELGTTLDLHEVSLEMSRFPEPGMELAFADFLEHRFAERRLDLVVPIGAPAAQFVGQFRNRLFPDSPVLIAAGDPRLVPRELLSKNTAHICQKVNLPGQIEDILQLQPDTTNIVVVLGASTVEQFWEMECQREFQPFTNRIHFTWLSNLPLDQMRERVAALPPRSFVLFEMLTMDAAGVAYDNDDALKAIHASTRAPIFGYFASQLGLGSIGGRLYQDAGLGSQAASLGVRILKGEPASSIPLLLIEPPFPEYDWRELERWRIRTARLPSGSVIRFRQPTLWVQYGRHAAMIAAACLGQAVLIVLLVANLAKRRRAERTLRSLSGRLLTAQEEEKARLAKELHDGLSQNLALLAVELELFGQRPPLEPEQIAVRMQEFSSQTKGLSAEVHRLSHGLHPAKLARLGLAAAIGGFCREVEAAHKIKIEFAAANVARSLPEDIALCLYRVAQEAIQNVIKHSGAKTVMVELETEDNVLGMRIADDGKGFEVGAVSPAESLGLISMEERVRLVRGQIVVDSTPGAGTRIQVQVPLTSKTQV